MRRLLRSIVGAVCCGLSGIPLALLWALAGFAFVFRKLPDDIIVVYQFCLICLMFGLRISFGAGFIIGVPVYLLLAAAGIASLRVMAVAGALAVAAVGALFPGNPTEQWAYTVGFVLSGAVGGAAYWYGAERAFTRRGGGGRTGGTGSTS